MKVLLVNPKMAKGWRPYVIPPIGLCSLKASLIKWIPGIEVEVYDASGYEIRDVIEEVEEFKPDIVGMTTFTEARLDCIFTMGMIKKLYPNIHTILGGVFASTNYTYILKNYNNIIDSICVGEGELALVDHIKKGMPKGTFSLPPIKDLDELPFPNYSDLDLDKYIDVDGPCKGKPLAAICTSRGCPHNCLYCSSKSVWGNIRFRSIPNVLQELEILYHRRGYKMVSIIDDIFTVNKKRTIEFCEGLLKKDIEIIWKTQTRTDCVDLDLLKLMYKAGCRLIAYGVESGSPTILNNLNKKEDLDSITNAFQWTKEAGIESTFNVIVGSPGETQATLQETKNIIKKARPDHIATAALRGYPGTALWELGKAQGIYKEDSLLLGEDCFYYTGSMSVPQMYKELRKFVFLQAGLQGPKGWVELVRLGIKTGLSQPNKILMGLRGK